MEKSNIYERLGEDVTAVEAKQLIHVYLKEQIAIGDVHPNQRQNIAMAISGLAGMDIVYWHLRKEPDFAPYDEIMGYAMPLELPEKFHGDATWEELARLVRGLPN